MNTYLMYLSLVSVSDFILMLKAYFGTFYHIMNVSKQKKNVYVSKYFSEHFKRQPHKMVKHAQAIRQQ